MVTSGVLICKINQKYTFGVLGPNAAIVEGQKNLALFCNAKSIIYLNPVTFTSKHRLGFFSPEAERMAAKWITQSGLKLSNF
jgi:hypothetical protein